MKKSFLATVTIITFCAFTGTASAGVSCVACHDSAKDKVGPSITSIVNAYGSVDAVFAFMDSDAELEPKVSAYAAKGALMKPQMKKYRGLDDAKKAEVRAWFEAGAK